MATNPSRFLYISNPEFNSLLKRLNIDTETNGGLDNSERLNLIDRAVGELETDLLDRFKVPLQKAGGGSYASVPAHTQFKVKSMLMAKIRELVGQDFQKNVVVESTERFIDVKRMNYSRHLKEMLSEKKNFGLELNDFSEESWEPAQDLGVAKTDDDLDASEYTGEGIDF